MMEKMIKVEYKNKVIREYPENTTLLEIAHSFQNEYNFPILVAKVDNVVEELAYKLTKKCQIDFYDRSSTLGHTVYSHGVHFLLIVAIKKVLGNDAEVIIGPLFMREICSFLLRFEIILIFVPLPDRTAMEAPVGLAISRFPLMLWILRLYSMLSMLYVRLNMLRLSFRLSA